MMIVRNKIYEVQDWILTLDDLVDLLARTQTDHEMATRAFGPWMRDVKEKRGDAGVVREFNKTIKGDITIKLVAPGKYKIYYDFMHENIDDNPRGPKWRMIKKHLLRFEMTEEQADSAIDTFIRNAPYEIRRRYKEEQPVNVAMFIKNAAENYWHGVYENINEFYGDKDKMKQSIEDAYDIYTGTASGGYVESFPRLKPGFERNSWVYKPDKIHVIFKYDQYHISEIKGGNDIELEEILSKYDFRKVGDDSWFAPHNGEDFISEMSEKDIKKIIKILKKDKLREMKIVKESLFERKFSEEEREKMASKGTAMKDGSYPIANEQDLKNAIRAYGRAADKTAVKAHIKKRAHALGRTSDLPADWENVNEVNREEDEWADREIDRYQGKDVKEPVKKEFDWKDIIPDDDVDPKELEDPIEQERRQLISHIKYLEEEIWEKGNAQQREDWESFRGDGNLEPFDIETLEGIFMKASVIVNSLKSK